MKIKTLMKDKKGVSTFQGWSEAAILLVLFMTAIIFIVASMNAKYNQNKDVSFDTVPGLQDVVNSTSSDLVDYQNSMQVGIQNGTATFGTIFGLTLSSSYDILLASVRVFWLIISGGWISSAVTLMHLPSFLGTMFQLVYLISVGFILIKLLFRVNP